MDLPESEEKETQHLKNRLRSFLTTTPRWKIFALAGLVVIAVSAVFVLLLLSPFSSKVSEEPSPSPAVGEMIFPDRLQPPRPEGWFKTGQDADLILGPLGMIESGGPAQLNHPSKVFYDGKRLFVSDTRSHRVLIWNSLPTQNNQAADVVVGQKDMHTATSGTGRDKLNWPLGVFSDGQKLYVADADNQRVLIWNEIPTKNGVPADVVLGQPDFDQAEVPPGKASSARYITWPWGVIVVDHKLIVVGGAKAMIWNQIPAQNFAPADIVLGQPYFSETQVDNSSLPEKAKLYTARCVSSDGTKLLIGDYNANRLLIWNKIPSQNGEPADVEINNYEMGCSLTKNGMLLAAEHLGPRVGLWKTIPDQDNQKPDITIGLGEEDLPHLDKDTLGQSWGVFSDGERIFIADTNNGRVLIYNQIPTRDSQPADLVLGQEDFTSTIFAGRTGMQSLADVATDGEKLWASYGNRILVWNSLPQKSQEPADGILISKNFGPQDNRDPEMFPDEGSKIIPYKEKLVVVSREQNRVLIWNEQPTKNGQKPDLYLGKGVVYDEAGDKNFPGGCSKTQMNQPQGGAISNDGRLFVADTQNRRILIWNTIPTTSETPPDLVIGQPSFETCQEAVPSALNRFGNPYKLSIDGQRLVVLDSEYRRLLVWNRLPTRNDQAADYELTQFSNPANTENPFTINIATNILASQGHLFLAAGDDRVLVWKVFPQSEGDAPDVVLGQPDMNTNTPGKGKNKIKMPKGLAFDGSYLWVGEHKFADRLLRFSVQP